MGSAASRQRRGEALPPAAPPEAAEPLPVGLQLPLVLLQGPDPPFPRLLNRFDGLPTEAQQAPPPPVPVLTGVAHAFFEAGIPRHPWDAEQPVHIVPYNLSTEGMAVVRKYLFRPLFSFWRWSEAVSRIGHVLHPQADQEDELCLFCTDEFRGNYLRRLPCDHLFHRRCIDYYFQMGNGNAEWQDGPVCPLCRVVFFLDIQ
ncbi:hypothetical protein E2562_039330 [Oryza meyeriana var. granulata]|uniref:RING-type domain-containing protein n=1 Tax=Oryza meyeriana var. granulata TaxID=110450 RepID=A0A6G1FH16_9ORYZ|nr:hypothetical protein E2562_039330 [Oryza meyeriana var. granulata]